MVRGASKADKLLVVYFHGNGDTLSWRTNRDRLLVADGTGLLAISYRGFEGSSGNPSETGFHLDAMSSRPAEFRAIGSCFGVIHSAPASLFSSLLNER